MRNRIRRLTAIARSLNSEPIAAQCANTRFLAGLTFASVRPCRIVRLPIERIGLRRGADGMGPPLKLQGLLAWAAKCRGDAGVALQVLVLPRIRDSIEYDLETVRHGNANQSSLRTTIGAYRPDHGEPARAYVR